MSEAIATQERAETHPNRGRLSARISDTIADLVEDGTYPLGSRLPPERELMRRFGVSRAAIREAIAEVANRGLLLTRPGHRPVVQRPDYDRAFDTLGRLVGHLVQDEHGIRNLFETRMFLEAALARHAASRARPGDIADLERALGANKAAIGNHAVFYATDIAFHEVLYRIPRNPIYPAVHKAYVEWLMRHWMGMPRGAQIDRMNYAAHEAIFRAIVSRDGDRAEQALTSHLTAAWEFVRTTLGDRTANTAG